ncbi:MAG: UvrD-helicase domain-containing protein [Eubacterium sp.]|nr:UvrD-helicase domain-containing protein [Eubacterium sp.]
MTTRKWTDAQQAAIDARGSNILVSAAAGSGKTAVLVERVIRMITDKSLEVNVDNLLVVTFTKAAAAEMKSRIAQALDEIIANDSHDSNALKQRALLPNAKICTIDAFCANVVREYFFKLGISQDFTVLDEAQKAVIEQDVLDEIVDKLYRENNNSFKELVELFSTVKSDEDLIKAVKKIDDYITAQPFPLEWLREVCELYNPDVDINESYLKKFACGELENAVNVSLDIIDYLYSVITPDDTMYELSLSMLDSDKAQFLMLKNCVSKSWNEIYKAINSLNFSKKPDGRKGLVKKSEDKSILFPKREMYLGSSSPIEKVTALFSSSEEEFRADNVRLYPIFKQLTALVEEFHNKCFEAKNELNAYTFSDIMHFAIELLCVRNEEGKIEKSDIARDYEKSFKEILVDEYQDTNKAQDSLFELLSNGNNRFMVGDVKQSIYRFRLAMPEVFNEKKDSFSKYSPESDELNQKIILDKNFRSNSAICEYVNFVFSRLLTRKVGGLDYTRDEYLNCGSENREPPTQAPVELNIVSVPGGEKTIEFEARQIAREILEMVGNKEQVREKEGTRDVNFGDIAVLLRSDKGRISVYSKVFSEFGIPVIANNKNNLFENNEVSILISLLRTIDNPTLDIPLLATLMSVFYGYSADDIAAARVKHTYGNLYSAVAADKERFSSFLTSLDKYRKYAASMSIESLLRQIISDTSYMSLISAMGNFKQRHLNVLKLISLAKRFDSGDSVGLTVFIRFLDGIVENDVEYDSASITGISENSVRIMTLHGSKGLEFPVCILAGAANKYNYRDLSNLYLLNNRNGIGLKVLNQESLSRYNSVQYECIKAINGYAAISENLRALYVAITRAKDKFIAFASYNENDRNGTASNKIVSLAQRIVEGEIKPCVVSKANSDSELLILTALVHPDGAVLREISGEDVKYCLSEPFPISVNYITDDVTFETEEEETLPADSALVDEIRDKLSFIYENSGLSGFAAKRIASSLDENEQDFRFFASKVPSFISGKKLSGADRGTAVHTFMQHCDFAAARSDISAEIERLTESGLISAEQGKSLDTDALGAMLNSSLAERIIKSDALYRELDLSSFVPLSQLEETDSGEKVLVIGVADCVFEENGELVLVDYKTDRVKNEDELLALYKNQIAFYKSAVEKTLNKKVKETMLYSFSLGKCCYYN